MFRLSRGYAAVLAAELAAELSIAVLLPVVLSKKYQFRQKILTFIDTIINNVNII
jgi:hypothetical protein